MGNFAVIKNGIVENVIVAEALVVAQSLLPDYLVIEIEPNDIAAGVGSSYEGGKFIPPKPFDSWVLNEDASEWISPVARPVIEQGQMMKWNEDELKWDILEDPFFVTEA
jgi:hypothetical protein